MEIRTVDKSLQGHSILIVEDEPLIAAYLADLIEDAGGTIIGTASSTHQALGVIAGAQITAAILDVNLRDGEVTPVALELKALQIPFIVFTGSPLPLRLRSVFSDAPVLLKGATSRQIIEAITETTKPVRSARSKTIGRTGSLGHVLLIEDEADTAVILEGYMRAFGCESVELADTEHDAIWVADRRRPDLMIVDIKLREGNGLTAALNIHKRLGTPLVVVTAFRGEVASVDQALVVRKPFTRAGLRTAIDRARPGMAS